MKIKANGMNQNYEQQYLITDNSDNERVLGNASESWNREYWTLTMNDNPVSKRFDTLGRLVKYVIGL